MRTNIDIDDDLMAKAMKAGPYTTKKHAVEAGLKLLARQAAYREILKWRGKLKWEGDDAIDWTQPAPAPVPAPPDKPEAPVSVSSVAVAAEPAPAYKAKASVKDSARRASASVKRRAGR